jgi:hypothetical protein
MEVMATPPFPGAVSKESVCVLHVSQIDQYKRFAAAPVDALTLWHRDHVGFFDFALTHRVARLTSFFDSQCHA